MDLRLLKNLAMVGGSQAEKEVAQDVANAAASKAASEAAEYAMPDTARLGVNELKDVARQYEQSGASPYHPTMRRIQQAINRKMDAATPKSGIIENVALSNAPRAMKYIGRQMVGTAEAAPIEADVSALPEAYRNPANDGIKQSMDPMDFVSPTSLVKGAATKLPGLAKMLIR